MRTFVLAAVGGVVMVACPASADAPSWHVVSTEHLGQLTGPTPDFLQPVGITGTDLGVSFQLGDALLFAFGDSWSSNGPDVNVDSLAHIAAQPPPAGLPTLTWYTRPDGRFLPLTAAGVDLGGMNVPIEGVPVGDRLYMFYSTGWSAAAGRHSTSVLAHSDPPYAFERMTVDHAVASDKFINLSVVVDPSDSRTTWIWGSGVYRQSAVYLARVRTQRLGDRSRWQYYEGLDSSGRPLFGPGEQTALPVVDASCVGELSVRRHERLGYLMAYNCGMPERGIHLRSAPKPHGPWSDFELIYEPSQGYEHFMHAQESTAGHDDGLSEPGREQEWGGEYGPYMIPAWFSEPEPGAHALYWTLSSWNPYAVQLMRTVLAEPGSSIEAPEPGLGLPRAALSNARFDNGSLEGWHAEGDGFASFQDPMNDGRWSITTFTGRQDAAVGRLWQDFTIDAQTSTLSFKVHGGHAQVALYVDGRRVRRTRGRDTNDSRLSAVWNLETLRGKSARLVVEDELASGPWGFVSVSGFELR